MESGPRSKISPPPPPPPPMPIAAGTQTHIVLHTVHVLCSQALKLKKDRRKQRMCAAAAMHVNAGAGGWLLRGSPEALCPAVKAVKAVKAARLPVFRAPFLTRPHSAIRE